MEKKSIQSILLKIRQVPQLDHEVAAITDDLMAADGRFNTWFVGTAKYFDDEEKIIDVLEIYENCILILNRATEQFVNERARDELIMVEKEIIERLKATMG